MAETDNPSSRLTAIDIQQQYFEAVGDADWELYEEKDKHLLLQKVALALCGPPKGEGDLMTSFNGMNSDDIELQGYPSLRDKEAIMRVFNKICEQVKYSYNGKNIVISVLQVVCLIPIKEVGIFEKTPSNYWSGLQHKTSKDVTILVFHVFGIRKCISIKSGQKKNCRRFIDHDARVYKDWNNYLKENKLPKCVMVVPTNGEYRGISVVANNTSGNDSETMIMPRVQLTVVSSPALGIGPALLEATDKASIGISVGSLAGIGGAILFAPLAVPAAVTTAIVAGVGTGIYSIIRASINLADRAEHEQTISMTDSEARLCWINIIMSTVGISFTAAGKLLAWAAASGTSVEILMNAVQFLQYTNHFTSAVGVVNSIGDMAHRYAKYGETPTTSEYFQLSVSALFFGIGAMSNQTAQEIVKDAQAQRINSVRDSLSSNVKRKIFDKVTAETRRLKGYFNGNADVIKALDKIENKDQFFAKIGRMNKQMNQNKMRISLTPDGNTLLNNKYTVSLNKLSKLGNAGRNKLFSDIGPAKITTKNAPTRIYSSTTSFNSGQFKSSDVVNGIRFEEIIKITQFLAILSKADKEFIAEVLSNLSAKIHQSFLLMCAEILSALLPEDLTFIKSIWPDFEIRLVLFIYNYILKPLLPENDIDDEESILAIMKKYIRNGRIDKDSLLNIKQQFMDYVKQKLDDKNKYDDPNKYDDLHKFRANKNKQFMKIRAGEVFNIGEHKILVKPSTIEMFSQRLKDYTQTDCDNIFAVIFSVIASLDSYDMRQLIMINPDEDIIMRMMQFIFDTMNINELLARLNDEKEGNLKNIKYSDIIMFIKTVLSQWQFQQRIRNHCTCKKCGGISYDI